MLAQNFMTPTDLGILDIEHRSLRTVLGMLERGECDEFDMRERMHDCGTPSCIKGWAQTVAGSERYFHMGRVKELDELFYPKTSAIFCRDQRKAALALRNYLTTGKANWHEILPVGA